MQISGRVWKFGDNIDTDAMAPGIYVGLPTNEFKKYCLKSVRPEFPENVRPGDLIVAGRNFGCGSSREIAPENIKALGISGILAESTGRIFFRNCIAIGLPIVICPEVAKLFNDGDQGEIDPATGTIKNLSSGQQSESKPLSSVMLNVLEAGGIMPLLKKRLGKT